MGRPEYNDSITSGSGDDAASDGETYLGTVYFGGQGSGTSTYGTADPYSLLGTLQENDNGTTP